MCSANRRLTETKQRVRGPGMGAKHAWTAETALEARSTGLWQTAKTEVSLTGAPIKLNHDDPAHGRCQFNLLSAYA